MSDHTSQPPTSQPTSPRWLTPPQVTPQTAASSTADALRRALRDALAHFRQPRALDASWVPDYLNRRNLYPQLRFAGIGHAAGGWTNLLEHLRSRGHTDDTLLAAGLVRETANGNLIDHFRDRLMIPVVDPDRQLAGFIGRAAPDAAADVPKYLNSPATQLFDKSQLLYALGEDRAALAAGAMPILVEGPLDRLALRQAARSLAIVGLAPLGTAFTQHQAELLAATVGTRRPVAVALDPDTAGRHAMLRVWDRLTEAGLTNLLHVALPVGRDPADLVRAGRGQQLRHAIISARPMAMAVADQRVDDAGPGIEDFQKRYAILKHVIDHDLRRVPIDRIGPYLGHLSTRLQLDHETVTDVALQQMAPGPPPPGGQQMARLDRLDRLESWREQVHAAEGFPTSVSPLQALSNPSTGLTPSRNLSNVHDREH